MKVLIADDDPVNRRILETFLGKWGYEVVSAADGNEAWSILQSEDAPRLVILDWMMPGMDGAQICRAIRQRSDPFYTYIMMITAKFQKQDVLEGLAAGADDYLTKPLDSNELRARLRTGERILNLQEDLLRTRDRLQYQASHDSLTGVWNHGAILEILHAELARCKRERLSVGVLMLDIDHFKTINDRYGHMAGDAVLREAVRRLRTNLRPYDSIGRYGGEEFLVVLPNSRQDDARKEAERLRRAIADSPLEVGAERIPVTISIGVSVCSHPDSISIEALLKCTDAALYLAKQGGRNRTEASWENPLAACEAPRSSQNSSEPTSTS
ncbi:MAG TPA: diguanylate cyclase [Terriglobia bacterium]|nr:diguanylate cyclase [Terriglobia bacterium]